MIAVTFLVAQVTPEARSVWDIALQFGMAGAVLVVVVVFVRYLQHRDTQDERRDNRLADALVKLADQVGEQNANIARLDGGGPRRPDARRSISPPQV